MALTRITFPYLALVSIETLFAGILNANNRFAAAAGAPILLNLSIITTLLLAPFFPDAGHAAAWGVLAAGVIIVLVVGIDAETHGIGIRLRMPRLDEPTRRFLKALGPAIIGAGGVQLALFADTLIASFLPTGALSALYYADRINQLPIGVVGIAVGTVLLPEMSRRLAAGDEKGAASAQARGIQLALLLTIPCAVASIVIPDLIMRALFARGAFTVHDAAAAGATLAAYSIGLLPFVLMRSFTAPFYARGDTATPVKAALLAAAINILLKVLLMGHLAQVGLALATSVGAWINLSLLARVRPPPGLRRVGRGHRQAGGEAACLGRGARGGAGRRRLWARARACGHERVPRGDHARRSSSSSARWSMAWRCLLLLGRPLADEPAAGGDGRGRYQGAAGSRTARPDRRFGRASRQRAAAEGLMLSGAEVDQLDRGWRRSAGRRKIAPTRAKRSGESVAKKRALSPPASVAALNPRAGESFGHRLRRGLRRIDQRHGLADGLADDIGEHREMRAAEHQRIRRRRAPEQRPEIVLRRRMGGGRVRPAFLGQRHEHLAGLLHDLGVCASACGWRAHRRRL